MKQIKEDASLETVEHPSHYNQHDVETINIMKVALTTEEYRGFLKGSVIKYLDRLGFKDDPRIEIGKAQWYAQQLETEELETFYRLLCEGRFKEAKESFDKYREKYAKQFKQTLAE